MRNLTGLEEAVVGSGCAAHPTVWCEVQTSVKIGVLENYS